jgi:hypothetical protein
MCSVVRVVNCSAGNLEIQSLQLAKLSDQWWIVKMLYQKILFAPQGDVTQQGTEVLDCIAVRLLEGIELFCTLNRPYVKCLLGALRSE